MSVGTRIWFYAAAAAVLLLAAALRIRGLERWSFNNDEIAQVRWSSLPFREMMREVRRDAVHPPLDYFIQLGVARLDGPEWVRRLPNVIFGVGTVALVMLLGTWWSGPAAGVLAGFLLALAPMHIRYSQEVRPYSSALFLILAALVCLELFARMRRVPWAIGWSVLVFLAGSTLYFGGMVAGAVSISRIFVDRKDSLRTLWRWLPAIILAWTLLYSPWFAVVKHVATSPSPQAADRLEWPWWRHRAQAMASGSYVDESVTAGSWAFWLAVSAGIVASVRNDRLRVATFWFIVGGALQVVVLQIRPHYSDPRYLMSAWPAAFVLAGAGLAALSRWWFARPVVAMILVLFAGYAILALRVYYRGDRSEWRTVAAYVQERVKPGETIVLSNFWVVRNFGYYFRTPPPSSRITIRLFSPWPEDLIGPAWIVSGQCVPRQALRDVGLMQSFPTTEFAQVRYLRPGQHLVRREEICPE